MPGIRRNETRDDAKVTADGQRPPLDPFAGVPDEIHEIAADELLAPLIDPGSGRLLPWRKQTTNAPIVQLDNAYITGKLDLRAADLQYLFRFENCRFENPPDVREANLLGLVFRRCWLPGLKARNFRSRNDVRLIRSRVEVPANGGGDGETTVRRAEKRDRGVPDAAVNFTDAVVEGSVVLTHTRIEYPHGKAIQADRLIVTGALLAYRLRTEGEVRIPGLRTGGNVNFSGATLHNAGGLALNGNGLQVGGSLLCEVDTYGREQEREPFSTRGVIYLPSAKVDSDLILRGAVLRVDDDAPIAIDAWQSGDPYLDPRPALMADRLRVDGTVELSDGLSVRGTVRMVNAAIGGSMRLTGAEITVPRGQRRPYYDRALHIDGCRIDGDLEASNLRACGQLSLADVTVHGNVLAEGATLRHRGREVFGARRASIAGNFMFADATVEGTVRLQGGDVGGSVEMVGTQLHHPMISPTSSFSLDLRTARIGRDVVLTANQDRPFIAAGGVTVDGAAAGRKVDLDGAELSSTKEHGIALDAGDVGADEMVLTPAETPDGMVLLSRAHCGTLDDNEQVWHAKGGVDVEDFRYDSLAEPVELRDDAAVQKRLRWLRKAMNGGYRPGPYDQLAAMLRTSGNDEHADTVLQRKQQFRYEALASGYRLLAPGVRLWSWLQRWMVGYGYRPVRAVAWLLFLLVAGSLWFGLGGDDCVNDARFTVSGSRCLVNSDDAGLEWNPVLYTVDLLVPIVDFGHKGRWHMAGADMWVASGFTAMGWVLATTVAAGASRSLRRTS